MPFISSQSIWTCRLLTSCLIATMSASFMFGYGIGGPNQYSKIIDSFLDSTKNENDSEFKRVFISGISQTLFVIGNLIGAFTGSIWFKCSSFFNRKRMFYVNYTMAIIYSGTMIFSQYRKIPLIFYYCRFLNGLQGGMACVIVPPYLNEISPQSLRGKTGTMHQLFITIGILVAQIIGTPIFFGRDSVWSIGLALGSLTSLLAFFLTPNLMEDSPSQILAIYRDESKARRSLSRLRRTEEEVNVELRQLLVEQNDNTTGETISVFKLFTAKRLRWQFITTMVLMVVQALCGINAVFFYSTQIFETAGITEFWLPYSTVCTGLINVGVTILVMPLIERFGRRPLLLYPMTMMIVNFIALITLIELNSNWQSPAIAWAAVACTIFFIVCFAIGLGPIPYIYACEVFGADARDAALSVSLCANYIGNILLCLFFPAINRYLRGYVFALFAGIIFISLVLLYFKMPETKNKSIEELEREFTQERTMEVELRKLSDSQSL
ncbi:hypothetical protein ACOME3_004794 [Neoechinorhynchus agilis]